MRSCITIHRGTTMTLTFHQCCEAIISDKCKSTVNWAVGYAEAGLALTDPHAQAVQALYILNNIQFWRGHAAKATRAALKEISKPACA